jgi:hypothetical protein
MIVPCVSNDKEIHPIPNRGQDVAPHTLPSLKASPDEQKMISDERTGSTGRSEASDERKSSKIEELMYSRSSTYCRLCAAAFIGAAIQITECELLYNNHNVAETTHTVLKIASSFATIVMLRLIMLYYAQTLAIGKVRKVYNKTETMVSTKLYIWMLVEMSVCAVHPLPFVDRTFSIEFKSSLDGGEVDAIYSYDSMLNIMSLARLYLLFRAGHYFVGFSTQTDAQMLAVLNDVSIGPWFTFRNALHKFPFLSIGFLLFILNITSAYALREAERPVQSGFKYYWNSLWCSIMTITTVGYGDLYPISHPGRVVAVCASILGTAILALFIAAVFEAVQFDNAEKRLQRMLYKSRLGKDLKNAASKLITDAIRLKIAKTNMDRAVAHHDQGATQKPVLNTAGLLVCQRFREHAVQRSVRAFKVTNGQRISYARNDEKDPTVHLAISVSALQEKVHASTQEQTEWNKRTEQQLSALQDSTKAIDRRLALMHGLLERQLK